MENGAYNIMFQGALDTIGGPVKRAITSALQSLLSKYIKHIKLEGAGVTSDIVLTNLELRLDVFRKLLRPLGFEITRGFVKEIRISIPWLSISSTPIEIKVDTVEFILEPASKATSTSKTQDDEENDTENEKEDESSSSSSSSGGGWIQSLLTNILANIRVKIDNVIVKCVHKDIVLSLGMESLHFFTADPENNWIACNVAPPKGPRRCIHKAFEIVNATLMLDRYADGSFTKIPLMPEYAEMPILDRTSFAIRAHVALDPHHHDDNDDEEEETSSRFKHIVETFKVGKRIHDAAPPKFVPNKQKDPKQSFNTRSNTKTHGIQVAVIEAHIPHIALRLTKRQVDIFRELISVITKAAIRKQLNRTRSSSGYAKSVASSRSRASTTSGDEKSEGTMSDRTYTTDGNDDSDLDDLDTFEDADDTFDAASVNEEMKRRGQTSWTGWLLGEDSDDSMEAEFDYEESRENRRSRKQRDEEWTKALRKLAITSTIRLDTLSFVLMRHVEEDEKCEEEEEEEEFMDVPVPKTVSPFGKIKVRTRSKSRKKRVQQIVELRLNRLHAHVRTVISGITPFLDLFLNLESIHAIPLLRRDNTTFLSWGRHVVSPRDQDLPGQNLGLFKSGGVKTRKKAVTFAEDEQNAEEDEKKMDEREERNTNDRGSSQHSLCGRVLIPLPLSEIGKEAMARSGSSEFVSMLVDVAIGPLSMWWDNEIAAVVLEVFANSEMKSSLSPSKTESSSSRRSSKRRKQIVKLVEEWSMPNWKYVVTLSSVMVRGAKKSSSSNGVGVLNIRNVEAEMGSGEHALIGEQDPIEKNHKDASFQASMSEADFGVFCDGVETKMIRLRKLFMTSSCSFLNLENIAICDVQCRLDSCRVDLVPTALLPFISTISSTVKSLLLVSRAYKEVPQDKAKIKMRGA